MIHIDEWNNVTVEHGQVGMLGHVDKDHYIVLFFPTETDFASGLPITLDDGAVKTQLFSENHTVILVINPAIAEQMIDALTKWLDLRKQTGG